MNTYRQGKAYNEKIVILYQRLSRDDGDKAESDSIQNQRRILTEYADRNNLTPYINIHDDGYSGANWNRPGWQEIISKIENNEVSVLIIKNLDRMGRDYLRAGAYREMFREKGVRLIAVEDNFDSDKGDDDFTPFREIMSEYFARDTSRKIKAVIRNKGRSGKPLGTLPPYGFRQDPHNKGERIIDEESATIIRRIFQMTLNGIGPYQIAKIFVDEKIERPSYYMYRVGIVKSSGKCNMNLPYNWSGAAIIDILKKREYMGDLENFKTHKPSFKSKKQVATSPEERLIFEGALPAIVDKETWELAQKMRRTVRRQKGKYELSPLTGLLFCADCGGKLHHRRSHYDTDKNGKKIVPSDNYECKTFRNHAHRHIDKCSLHFIRTVVLQELILDVIRNVSTYARENEAAFIEKLRETTSIKQKDTAKTHRRQLSKNEKRIAELDLLFRKVYEDNAIGKLSDERYEQMSRDYEQEQAELKVQTVAIIAKLEAFEQDSLNVDRFMELVHRYTTFDKLTTPMLHEFVDKVLVHEADRSTGERVQQVDIYLNFVGQFVIPGTEPVPLTPEEQMAEEARLAKKRHKNEVLRKWRAKKKAEKLAAENEEKTKI